MEEYKQSIVNDTKMQKLKNRIIRKERIQPPNRNYSLIADPMGRDFKTEHRRRQPFSIEEVSSSQNKLMPKIKVCVDEVKPKHNPRDQEQIKTANDRRQPAAKVPLILYDNSARKTMQNFNQSPGKMGMDGELQFDTV